jgi:hypothetical protein
MDTGLKVKSPPLPIEEPLQLRRRSRPIPILGKAKTYCMEFIKQTSDMRHSVHYDVLKKNSTWLAEAEVQETDSRTPVFSC